MVALSSTRVASNTDDAVNQRLERELQARLAYYREHRDDVPQRLRELDEEWDVERALATVLTLSGLLLSLGVSRKWLLLSLGVQGFYLQHALQGWCPPLPVFRKLGFRTPDEINRERYALRKLLDGRESPR